MKILDYIDQNVIQEIQDLFSTSTGLAAIAVDAEGKYITEGSNFTDFCMKYTRNSKIGKERCEKCDAECSGTYFCHAGLMDFSEDIIINGKKVGAIIGGQVLPKEPDIEAFRSIAKELDINPDEYIKALQQVPIKTEEAIRASAKLLGQIVNQIVNMAYLQQSQKKAITIMDTEIKKSIVNVEDITKRAKELENIASKQNILALNASIEAARAGEAGKGFVVVAKQMGELSKKSGTIYDDIQKDAYVLKDSIIEMSQSMK